MKIGAFQQIAKQDGRVVMDSKTNELKTSSFKGKVLSHLKGEAKERNEQVKDAFIKTIKDTYGNDAAASAKQMIGGNGKALMARDVKKVLDQHMTVHRTHGEVTKESVSDGSVEKGQLKSGLVSLISELTKREGKMNNAEIRSFAQNNLTEAEQRALKHSPEEKFVAEMKSLSKGESGGIFKGKSDSVIERNARAIKNAVEQKYSLDSIQGGDIRSVLTQGVYGVSGEISKLEIGSATLNKIVMATDEELATAIRDVEPTISDYSAREVIRQVREFAPSLALSDDGKTIKSANIGGKQFDHVKHLGTGGFGEAHLMRDPVSGETLVVKKMLVEKNADPSEKAEKLAEARKEVRAHDYALAGRSEADIAVGRPADFTPGGNIVKNRPFEAPNIAKIKTALYGSDGLVSIALEACEKGDIRGLVGKDGNLGKIDVAAALPSNDPNSITKNQAKALKKLMAHDILSGMKVLQEDRQMMHLDMKPDNVFLGNDGVLKIGDFGNGVESTSMTFKKGEFFTTPEYEAPEIFRDVKTATEFGATTKADSYTIGVMLYELSETMLPFHSDRAPDETPDGLKKDWYAPGGHTGLAQGKYTTADANLNDVINGLTHPDPEQRITMSDALAMPHFADVPAENSADLKNLRTLLANIA